MDPTLIRVLSLLAALIYVQARGAQPAFAVDVAERIERWARTPGTDLDLP